MTSDGRLSGRFDPILRELLTEHMAVRPPGEGDGDGDRAGWVLTEVVQRRLDELHRSSPNPDKVALYFGHRCAVCQQFVATRRVDGRFVCSACAPKDGAAVSSGS